MSLSLLREAVARAKKDWPFIDEFEKQHKLPSRLLYALGWRESNLENVMGDFSKRSGESAAQFHGFGVWQRDSDAFGVGPSYLKNVRRQAKDAAELLASHFARFQDWPAAVAAYNAGAGGVQSALDAGRPVDSATTGGDYSTDVLNTRQLLVRGGGGDVGTVVDLSRVPARSYFKAGKSHPNFTFMGERFLVWLKGDISHDGNGYQPGPGFTSFDAENVRKCQVLMGDEPDGWFGSLQWEKLGQRPPKRPPSVGAAPVSGLRVTQSFGVKNKIYAADEHTGVDFGSSGDDTIRCTAPGVVVRTAFDADGFGNYVIVQHDGQRFSWYCHLTKRNVSVGDRVQRGDQVGVMGSTGNSFGKHLHYQETQGGTSYWDYASPKLL